MTTTIDPQAVRTPEDFRRFVDVVVGMIQARLLGPRDKRDDVLEILRDVVPFVDRGELPLQEGVEMVKRSVAALVVADRTSLAR